MIYFREDNVKIKNISFLFSLEGFPHSNLTFCAPSIFQIVEASISDFTHLNV